MRPTNEDYQRFFDDLQAKYPLPEQQSESLRSQLTVQVVEAYQEGGISQEIAEERWITIIQEYRQRPAGQPSAENVTSPPEPAPALPVSESAPPDAEETSGESVQPTEPPSDESAAVQTDVIMPETESPEEVAETVPLNAEAGESQSPEEQTAADAETEANTGPTVPVDKASAEESADDAGQSAPPLSLGQVPTEAHQSQTGEVLEEQAGTPVPPPPPPKPFIRPEWKVLEPEDQSDPVPHELSETLQRNEQWKIAAASVRGRLHAHKALWRDDAYAIGEVDDWTILVVSDGAGSAPLARIGARACADAARNKLTELLDGFFPSSFAADASDTSDLGRVKTFLCEAGRAGLYAVQREAQQRERQLRDFHATLLVMIHLPLGDRDLVAALQVGDGAVGIYTQDGNCTLLGIADHGEYSSETRFITTPNIEREFGARVLFAAKENVVALAAMCDGISDDFFPEDKRLVELFIGGEIEGMKFANDESVDGLLFTVAKEEDSGKALLEWMKYEKKGSSDDRTLLLMYRPELVEKV